MNSTQTWILLRGLTRESRHWGDFPARLRAQLMTGSPDVEVLTPNLPGNGWRNTEVSPTHVEEMAEILRTDLLAQGATPPFHLLAMSLGAMVAVAWAARYPAEISGAVLINTSLRPFNPFYQRLRPANYPRLGQLALFGGCDEAWENCIHAITSRRPAMREATVSNWLALRREHPVSRANALRQLIAAARFTAPVEAPPVPLLVLASCQDALVDSRCSRMLARRWSTAFAEHPDAGHDLPLDDGDWVIGKINDWLRTRQGAAASDCK